MKTDVCGLEHAGSASNFGAWNLGFDRTAKKNIRGIFEYYRTFWQSLPMNWIVRREPEVLVLSIAPNRLFGDEITILSRWAIGIGQNVARTNYGLS